MDIHEGFLVTAIAMIIDSRYCPIDSLNMVINVIS